MATEFQITCTRKSDRTNVHERIHSVGCATHHGTKIYSQAEAISAIRTGLIAFYVVHDTKKVRVIVAQSEHGHPYLRTEADDTTSNNLLSLPECR